MIQINKKGEEYVIQAYQTRTMLTEKDLEAETKEEMIHVILKYKYSVHYDFLYGPKQFPRNPPYLRPSGVGPSNSIAYDKWLEGEQGKRKANDTLYELGLKSLESIDQLYAEVIDTQLKSDKEDQTQKADQKRLRDSRKQKWQQIRGGNYEFSSAEKEQVFNKLKSKLLDIGKSKDLKPAIHRKAAEAAIEALREILDVDPQRLPATYEQTIDFFNNICPILETPKTSGYRGYITDSKYGLPVFKPDGKKTDSGIWEDVFGETMQNSAHRLNKK